MNRKLKKRTVIAIFAILAGGVHAQASQGGDDALYALSLDELMQVEVGIASKRPETVRQAPSAVTVFTRREIQAMGVEDVYDLLNYVPGFQTTRTIDVVDQSLIHGRGLANLNGQVLVLLNGHRLNENSLGLSTRFTRVLSTSNVKQVEVIRGPGSALYGSNAFLGVVNIITVSGVNDAGLHAGAHDAVGGYANLAKDFNGLAVNASLGYDHDRGEDYYKGADYPQGPQSTSDPSQNLNFYSTLALHGTTLEVGYMNHENQDFLNFNGVAPSGQAWSESAYAMAALSHDWTLSDALSLKGGMSLSRHELSSVGWFGAKNPASPTNPYFADRLLGPYTQNSAYEATLDLTWRVNSASDFMTGFSYRHEGTNTLGHYTNYWSAVPGVEAKPSAGSYLGGVERIENVPSLDSREQFLDNYGLYAQYRRDLTSTVHATAGGRYDEYDVSGGTFNPRVGLIWDAADDLTIKAFWGTAFRSPTLAELYTNSQRSVGNIALQPETVASTELVCQKRFSAVDVEAVYFHNHLTDVVERSRASDGRQTWHNADDQSYDGLEARVIWDALASLRLYLTHTHVFSSLGASSFNDFSSFIADYHAGPWKFNLNGLYRPRQQDDALKQNDYAVINAKLGYQLSKTLTLYSKADNLFDSRYVTYESPFSANNPQTSTPYYTSVPNQGLRWLLGLEAAW